MQYESPARGRTRTAIRFLAGILILTGGARSAMAQAAPPPSTTLTYPVDSGTAINTGATPQVVISFPVHVQGARWMRLFFDSVQLSGDFFAGTGATLRITSVWDAGVMEMSAVNVRQWQHSSAYFNGDTVLVEVVAHPGTGVNRVILGRVTADLTGPGFPETQCGPLDNRVPSQDPRVCRTMPVGCTGWMIDDCAGCYLTAGHCMGGTSVAQFNVPFSSAGGGLVNPPPSDQYAVDFSSKQSGSDYGYFGTFPNPNTGMTALQAQGSAFVLQNPPPFNANAEIRITGHGVDSSPASWNQVQQTHAGPWVSSTTSTQRYRTDTQGGNSGSPVIYEPTGVAIGIHTNGGCNTGGGGSNSGTSSSRPGLVNVLNNPKGICKSSINAATPMPTFLDPNVPTNVNVSIAGTFTPGSAQMHYRYQGGSFTSQQLTNLGGGNFQGTLPPGNCADDPEWYFSVDSSSCGLLTLPPNAPASGTFSAVIGPDVTTYCTGKSGLFCGIVPAITTFGNSSASAGSGFYILAGPARQNRTGLLLYTDSGANNAPFDGGILCVNTAPLRRGPATSSLGLSACDGEFVIDMNAFAAGTAGGNPDPFLQVAGTQINAQWWGRDSIASGSFLSNGLQFTVCP